MISKDKTYRTRDGREVRIYATDGEYPFVVHGAIRKEDGQWETCQWLNQGGAAIITQSIRDLIEVKPRHKRTVWLHVFNTGTVCATEDAYYDITNRIACITVDLDFEEGEGLTHGTYSVSSGGSPPFDNGGGFTPTTWTKITKEGL